MCVQIVQQMNFVRATNAKNSCDGGGGEYGEEVRGDTGPTCVRVCVCSHRRRRGRDLWAFVPFCCVVGHAARSMRHASCGTENHKFQPLNKLMAICIWKIHASRGHTKLLVCPFFVVISFPSSIPPPRFDPQSLWHFYHSRSAHQKVNDDNDKHFKSKHFQHTHTHTFTQWPNWKPNWNL